MGAWRVHAVLLSVSLIYGATYSIAKGLMPGLIGPSGFILIRVASAAILFRIVYWYSGSERVLRKDMLKLLLASVFGVSLNMLLFFNGLSRTNELNASVLMLNAPVFVVIFSALILKTRVHTRQVAGMLLAGTGALFLIGGTTYNFDSSTAHGDLMVMANAVSYAFYLVYVKQLLSRYSVLTITSYIFIFGLVFVLPIGLPELALVDFGQFSPGNWVGLVFVCLLTTFLAYFLNAWAVQKADSVLVGTYIYLQPVFATFIAQALGKQVLTAERVIFALLICLGVYLTGRNNKST